MLRSVPLEPALLVDGDAKDGLFKLLELDLRKRTGRRETHSLNSFAKKSVADRSAISPLKSHDVFGSALAVPYPEFRDMDQELVL